MNSASFFDVNHLKHKSTICTAILVVAMFGGKPGSNDAPSRKVTKNIKGDGRASGFVSSFKRPSEFFIVRKE